MPRNPHITRERDRLALVALHFRDVEGLTYARIGEILGVTKNAVIGMLKRVDAAYVTDGDDLKPENRDGAMDPRWWDDA